MRWLALSYLALSSIACNDVKPAQRDAGLRVDSGPAPDADSGVPCPHTTIHDADGTPPIVCGRAAQQAPDSAHPERLRIVGWNIKTGSASSLMAVADRIASLEPDVVVLQELDVDTRRNGHVDQPAVLAERLGFAYAFAQTIPWSGGAYGIATLSRQPFTRLRRIPLSNQNAGEARTALEALLCAADSCIRVLDHHADVRPQASAQSTREILETLAPELGTGLALLGDLNQVPTDPGPEACIAAGLLDVGAQYDAAITEGGRRIDYAFVDRALAPCVLGFHVEQTTESDHLALVLDLTRSCLPAPVP